MIYFQNLISSCFYNSEDRKSLDTQKITRVALSVIVALGARFVASTPVALLSGLLAYWLLPTASATSEPFTRKLLLGNKRVIFKDAEIAKVHTYQETSTLSNITVWKSHGKTVLQQPDGNAACATAAMMLAADHGKPIDLHWEKSVSSQLPNQISLLKIKEVLERRGLNVAFATRDSDLESIIERIDNLGPAIITIKLEDNRPHVIIVDKINKRGADIRDPYHGWSIRVKIEPFQKYIDNGGFILQIVNHGS